MINDFEQRLINVLSLDEITSKDIVNTFSFEEKMAIINDNVFSFEEKMAIIDENSVMASLFLLKYLRNIITNKKLVVFTKEEMKKYVNLKGSFYDVEHFLFPFTKEEEKELLIKFDPEIGSFCDSKSFIEKYDEINSVYLQDIIAQMDDKNRIELINAVYHGKIKDEKNIRQTITYYCILNLSSDELKIQYLKYANKEYYALIISSLENEKSRFELLNKYSHKIEEYGISIIAETLSDENMIKCIDNPSYKTYNSILFLKDEKLKLDYLKKYNKKMSINTIIEVIDEIKDEKVLMDCLPYFAPRDYYLFLNSDYVDKNAIRKLAIKTLNSNNDELLSVLEYSTDKEFRIEAAKRIKKFEYALWAYLKEDEYQYTSVPFNREMKDAIHSTPDFNIFLSIKNIEKINVYPLLEHIEIFPGYNDNFEEVFKKIAKEKRVNCNHLIKLAQLTDCSAVRLLNNSNIVRLLNLDNLAFNKIIDLVKTKPLDNNTRNTIFNIAIQKKFKNSNQDIINTFPNILHAVYDGDTMTAISLINNVLKTLNIPKTEMDPVTVAYVIIENEEVRNIFHEMVNKYIAKKREDYVQEELFNTIKKDALSRYDRKQLGFFLIKKLPEKIVTEMITNYSSELTSEEKSLINDKETLKDIINILNGTISFDQVKDNIKKKIKIFNGLLLKVDFPVNPRNWRLNGIKTTYVDKSMLLDTPQFVLEILQNLDVKKTTATILQKEELYSELMSLLNSNAFMDWSSEFSSIFKEADIDFSPDTISSLICNYDLIKPQIDDNKGLLNILNNANEYISEATIYSFLFGAEDCKLIKRNPTPSSSMTAEKRFKVAVEYLPKMFKKNSIPVPPINNVYKVNNKAINVCIEPSHSIRNLTIGERTGACTRIGGAGSSLFEFCLFDDQGFNITFNDPVTGNFISRVSCFRNGNTVFLNELRYSVDDRYENNDIIEACKQFAKDLIEESKKSSVPIENVIATNKYALSEAKSIPINYQTIQTGLPHFYTDYSNEAVVMAVADPTQEVIQMKFGNNIVKYPAPRDRVLPYKGKYAKNKVGHIIALDELFDGKDYTEMDTMELSSKVENIVYCYAGEDWYISVDSNYNINSYIMKNSKNKSAATAELNEAMIQIKKYVDDNKYKKGSSFESNGIDYTQTIEQKVGSR